MFVLFTFLGCSPATNATAQGGVQRNPEDSWIAQPVHSVTTHLSSVTCKDVTINTLQGWLYRKARVCYPDVSDGSIFPLHLFAHGDGLGGGNFISTYDGLQEQLAGFGFVVAGYLSCSSDDDCDNGESSFLEALKTVEYLEQNSAVVPVNLSSPYTVSGHSTGARVAMMLAAMRDSPKYLNQTKYGKAISDSMRSSIAKMVAFVGDHTDPMYSGLYQNQWQTVNPDLLNYNISKSAVFLITGSKDMTEPEDSSWHNFQMIRTQDKIHLNIKGDNHMEVSKGHHEGPWIAYFCRCHALGDIAARDKIYGTQPDALVNYNRTAPSGAYNNGKADVSFLACSSESLTVPKKLSGHCSPSSLLWTYHAGVNCYDGAGGKEIDRDSYGQMSVADCKHLCENTLGCTGITISQTTSQGGYSCLRRQDITISQCDKKAKFDTYTIPSVSAHLPDSPKWNSTVSDMELRYRPVVKAIETQWA